MALDASEGRRRRRKRDTNPDAIGMAIKRRLLEETVREDPAPDDFEAWLLDWCLASGASAGGGGGGGGASGPLRAMALEVLAEWRLAAAAGGGPFRDWLRAGAPSDDADR
jgi:hypothetical protein